MFSLMKRRGGAQQPGIEEDSLSTFRQEMDNLLQSFFGDMPALSWTPAGMVPRLDVSETDDAVEVVTDLPGFKSEEIKIDIGDNYLTVSGEHVDEEKTEGNGRKYHRVERRSGSFSRSVWLPCAVQEDKVDARLKDGVLTIKLPKAAEAQRRRITIKA